MTILERIKDKYNYLRKNSQEELDRINSILDVINLSIESLEDELKLKDYDFSIAINLVNSNSFGIIDLEKSITGIKNLLVAKYDYKQTFLRLSDEQKQAVKSFKERLGYLKEEFEKRIDEQSKNKVDEKTIENLEDLIRLLEGKGRRKYYTYDMLEALCEVLDYDELTYQDMEEFIKGLSVSKNIKGKIVEDQCDIEDVIELLQEYLGKNTNFNILKKYQSEICSRMNLVNARNILEFFKDNNILNNFSVVAILPVVVYGRFDYIKDFYFDKVLSKDDSLKDLYFTDAMSCVWINENSTKRKRNTSIRMSQTKGNNKSLYSTINEVCDDDVWENVRILKENEDLLDEKYNLANIDYLWVITKPTWLIKKNIDLFRLFNISDVTLTALVQNDLEDKMHFAVELGLLNTPRTYVFKEIEKDVPRYREFMLNGKKKNQSILNYFPRNTTEIGKTSYTEYIYWFYKMQRSSKMEFYQDFFSSYRAGRRNKTDFYGIGEEEVINNSSTMEKLIDDNFVINYYDALIPNYDIYERDIKEYSMSLNGDVVIPYFDESIIEDENVQGLEERMAIDIYTTDGEIRKVRNPYVYVFDKNIISRYKVLRNLSILKRKYGYLNDDMVLTAIVHNSYIDKETFDRIFTSIKREGVTK